MSNDKGSGTGRKDYTEVEFELGSLEFEAKGKAVVVERLFSLLLHKIESGAVQIHPNIEDKEEEETEEEVSEKFLEYDDEEVKEESETEEPIEKVIEEDTLLDTPLDPPPDWNMLDIYPPKESDIERSVRNRA